MGDRSSISLFLVIALGLGVAAPKAFAQSTSSHIREWPIDEVPTSPSAEDGVRDPFRNQTLIIDDPVQPTLRKFNLIDLVPKALIWKVANPVALVLDPEKREHFVRIGDPVGTSRGVVMAINETCVVIEETYVDWGGRVEKKQLCMHL